MSNIQQLLNVPNPDYDLNSSASKKRRAEFRDDPAKDIRQYVGKYSHPSLNDPQMTQFSSEWFDQPKVPKASYVRGQTPTANEEALQDPTIDPVFLAAGGLVGGEENMLDLAEQQTKKVARAKSIIDIFGPNLRRDTRQQLESINPSSLLDHISNFLSGAGTNIGGAATTQSALKQHKNVGRVGGLPAPRGLVDTAQGLLDWGMYNAGTIDE
jgi:predicted glycosyltransferase